MAEFCLQCFNDLNESEYTENEVELSNDFTLCETCGEYKPVVIKIKG